MLTAGAGVGFAVVVVDVVIGADVVVEFGAGVGGVVVGFAVVDDVIGAAVVEVVEEVGVVVGGGVGGVVVLVSGPGATVLISFKLDENYEKLKPQC